MPSCVIIVENLPVPLDRRVWQEACALRDAGWTVSVICPKSEQYPKAFETIDDIEVFRHPLPLEASGRFAFLLEYGAALFHEFRLLLKVARRRGFDVIQACNPPDLIFLVAAPFKLFGKRFVFDHHDVCPELFVAKFERRGFFHSLLLAAEKATFKTANLVISANETYRQLAISRGGKKPEDVVTVYSVPDKSRIRRVPPNEALRAGAGTVLGYIGIIADQDGVDHLVRCVHHLVADHGQTDVRAVVAGDGPALASVKALAVELGVADRITFTGYLRGEELLAALSTFDIGIIPDPVNEYNDKISMNKVFEYSALGIPSVSYNLTETKRLLGEAGCYAADATPASLAAACLPLITDLDLRKAAGERASALAHARFDWEREAQNYVAAYSRFLPDISTVSKEA
ncbi:MULTISPECIES: glycosyltransferase family 4 protein [unclassified Aureimonas]|uniref:glycosyltransferase family 4 protein n=1 Tax=unclassified Aureimonas TaxID=2615206 RepID=UPI0009EC04B1|nr:MULTISPECIES: glycosyltransferase family 4 protein [unclassified Aureimonas]